MWLRYGAVVEQVSQPALLCVRLRCGERAYVAHTQWLARELVCVQVDDPIEIGEPVSATLSFPGLLRGCNVTGKIAERRLPAGPAEPAGWVIDLADMDAPERDEYERLRAALSGAVPAHGDEDAYRVLLVEDSQMSREIFSCRAAKVLQNPDCIEVAFADGIEGARAQLAKSEFDLIIVDYFLDGDNGDSLIREIRSNPVHKNTAVFAVSTGGQEARDANIGAGADVFIHKPLIVSDLFTTLDRLIPLAKRVPNA